MTNDEYRQLIEFLTGKFGEVETGFARVHARFAEVDARFAQVDARFAQIDRRFAQVDAQFLDVNLQIRQLSERVGAEFDEVKGLIRLSYGDLDRRVRRLEEHS